MAAYATIDDVQRRMPQFTLTATTRPTIDSAQVFLDDTIAQFDAAMEQIGYVTPITGEKSLRQVIEIVSQGTICKILYARASAIGGDAAVQSAERACKQYNDALLALADPNNPISLVDAEMVGEIKAGIPIPPMGLIDNVVLEEDERYPRVTMDTKF
jgi:hypothetical protein